MKLFAFDSPVMQAISTATDYVILNLLWIVCSLPIFTAGAAASAKYYTSMKLYRGEAPAVCRSFFSSFAKNLKQTFFPSIVIFLFLLFLAGDWYYVVKNVPAATYRWVLFIVTLIFMMMVFCLFPIIARYQITTREAVKMALGMAAAHFLRVLWAVIAFVLPFFIGVWYFKWAWLICLFSQTVMLYYNSGFFVKEFDKLEARLFDGQNGEDGENKKSNGEAVNAEVSEKETANAKQNTETEEAVTEEKKTSEEQTEAKKETEPKKEGAPEDTEKPER